MSTLGSLPRAGALAAALVLAAPMARAAPPTKDECVDAHAKGQDAREAGQLGAAGKLFLLCAEASCPDLVRSDCARFADELERLRPTVTFAARDGAQRDLPDTAVFVDGALVAPHLGDGKARDIDPGRHEVRFVHAGSEVVVEVVVNQGEKGRAIVGTFTPPGSTAPAATGTGDGEKGALRADPPPPKRPGGPLVLVGLGAAAMAAGGVLLGVGLARLPATCSLSAHTCAAPPGDPVFDRASSSVTLVNLGAITGGVGAAAMTGSLIWYFAQAPRPVKTALVLPWAARQSAGVSLSGAF